MLKLTEIKTTFPSAVLWTLGNGVVVYCKLDSVPFQVQALGKNAPDTVTSVPPVLHTALREGPSAPPPPTVASL